MRDRFIFLLRFLRSDRSRLKRCLAQAVCLLGLILLAACAAATPQAVQKEVVVTVVVEKAGETVVEKTVEVEKVVEAPRTPTAASALSTATAAALEPGIQPTPAPTQPPAPLLTQPVPTPTAVLEARLVELEWPPRLRLGDSDVIRLALIPSEEGYVVQTEYPEHRTDVQQIQVTRPEGYELAAAARLDGVGFEISPGAEQERYLPIGETVTWLWSITPRKPGQQRLTVILLLRWKPVGDTPGSMRESALFVRSLDVQVASFFGLNRGQAMTGGFFGLLLGVGMSLFGLVTLAPASRAGGRGRLRILEPNPALAVEPAPGLALTDSETALLRSLFQRYARLVLEKEFLSGYSGARTFLAQPVRPDGRTDAQTIVKIGERETIQQEYANYEQFVRVTLPPVTARIQHPPVTTRGSAKAAIQYTFIAEPGHPPVSLRQALLANPSPILLEKLFDTFGPSWWMQRRPYVFHLSQEYDRVLPTHYVIEPASGRGRTLESTSSPEELNLQVGDLVTLRGFSGMERRQDGRSLSLLGTPAPGRAALRVRWLSPEDPNNATGRVVATRLTLLAEVVSGMDLYGLPDPLQRLPALSGRSVAGTQSTIHGDLNLENVLVGPGEFVWLIDFAMTREGHTLYDFAHLGAEIIAHVLAAQFASPEDYLAELERQAPFWNSQPAGSGPLVLLAALREIAGRCLFNPSQPDEFQLALYLACLGALKFSNLSPAQKHPLYLTAAHLLARL